MNWNNATYTILSDGSIAIYDSIVIIRFHPKGKNGEKSTKWCMFEKTVSFAEAECYWILEYTGDESLIYYVKRGKEKVLCERCPGRISWKDVVFRTAAGEISIRDGRRIEDYQSNPHRVLDRIPIAGVLWSEEYDNLPIVLLLQKKPKMTYNEIVTAIKAEGGSVDALGIVHKKQ